MSIRPPSGGKGGATDEELALKQDAATAATDAELAAAAALKQDAATAATDAELAAATSLGTWAEVLAPSDPVAAGGAGWTVGNSTWTQEGEYAYNATGSADDGSITRTAQFTAGKTLAAKATFKFPAAAPSAARAGLRLPGAAAGTLQSGDVSIWLAKGGYIEYDRYGSGGGSSGVLPAAAVTADTDIDFAVVSYVPASGSGLTFDCYVNGVYVWSFNRTDATANRYVGFSTRGGGAVRMKNLQVWEFTANTSSKPKPF